jgi:magnesium chelatase family protein
MIGGMLASLTSAALVGVEAEPVQVEVNANEEGEPRLILVGLPDAAVKESADRVFSALANCGFHTLRTRTTINLAPGGLRKEGPLYDLPIALGLLVATGQLEATGLNDCLIAGELGLSGATRPIRGALAIAQTARKLGKRALFLPNGSAEEAALVEGIAVYPIASLMAAFQFFAGTAPLCALKPGQWSDQVARDEHLDFSDLKGQPVLRRAIEVAVSGSHNLLVLGPPGAGKSMAAKRIAGIMPPPTREERLDILGIHSIAGTGAGGQRTFSGGRPFRAPHHTISDAALLGGGINPRPGEVSLAHHGILFLDELPEFRRSVLEVLRQPLEDSEITVSRCAATLTFPCSFMLVAAMNP